MTLQTGGLLYARYRIEDVIAQGGMGAIYRAFDESLGVRVALKENLYSTEESTRQFRKEATLLAGLRHPNLPRVTDHFSISEQGQYLVMDYIEGDDLRQRLAARGPLNEDEAIAVGAAVCDALQYLHTRQPAVVHRDIKLGNVKLTPNGQVFLVDFGLAKVNTPGLATATGAQALTPGYASPEQYGQGTTPLSDIYSLGATLYAALTNKIPEDGLARAMGTAKLTPLRSYAPAVSDRTAQVIEKAMAIKPEERFANAEALRLALLNTNASVARRSAPRPAVSAAADATANTVRIENSQVPSTLQFPTVVTPQAAAYVPAGRPKSLIWILIGLIGVAAITAVILLTQNFGSSPIPLASQTPTQPPLPTLLPATPTYLAVVSIASVTPTLSPIPSTTSTATSQPNTRTATITPTATLTFTPAPTRLGAGSGQITFASIKEGKLPQIWLVNVDGTKPQALTDMLDGACQPAWSPDGARLAVVSPCPRPQEEYPGSSLVLMNADGSNPVPLPSLPGGDFDPAWSPDGAQILFTSLREGTAHIFTINLADQKVTRITGAFSDDRRPAWSPDGKKIAFESTRLGQKQVWVMGSKGENQAEFTRLAEGAAFQPAWSLDGSILVYNRDAALPWIFARRTDLALSPESHLSEVRPVLRPRFSKDGQWLVFESWAGANHDAFIMRSNGTNRQAVTNDAAYDFDPVWKP